MTAAERAFAADVAGSVLGVLAVFAAVLGSFEVAELGGLPLLWPERLAAAAATVPAWAVAVLPVAAAAGAARVVLAWRRDARLVAVYGAGIGPERLAVAAMLGVAVAAVVPVAVREATAPLAVATTAQQGAWALLDAPVPPGADHGWFGAGVLLPDRAVDVRVAWVRDGVVVGRLWAPSAVWSDGWVVAGDAVTWGDGGAVSVDAVLPDPETWRRAAAPLSWEVPLRTLWEAPPGVARSAWLAERAATPALAVLLAGLAVVVGPRRAPVAGAGALALRLLAAGLLRAAARGAVGVGLAVGVPLALAVVALAAGIVAARRLG